MAIRQQNTAVLAPERSRVKPPRMYNVILLNDDYTTMDFVVEVLQRFFAMTRERALQTMLKIHNEGSAVCGVYTQDVAETKVTMISEYAKRQGHPLRCRMEGI